MTTPLPASAQQGDRPPKHRGLSLTLVISPSKTLMVGAGFCITCLWVFLDVYLNWPRVWAEVFYPLGTFAPAVAYLSIRDLWDRGWNSRLCLACLLATIGFGLWCAATYLLIHPKGT